MQASAQQRDDAAQGGGFGDVVIAGQRVVRLRFGGQHLNGSADVTGRRQRRGNGNNRRSAVAWRTKCNVL
jgi:hypothetical protein